MEKQGGVEFKSCLDEAHPISLVNLERSVGAPWFNLSIRRVVRGQNENQGESHARIDAASGQLRGWILGLELIMCFTIPSACEVRFV